MSALDGVLPSQTQNRHRRIAVIGLCLGLAILFASSGLSTLPILGVTLSVILYFIVAEQIRTREKAERDLERALFQERATQAAMRELEAQVHQSGKADQAIAHALALQEKLRATEALHESLVHTLPFFIFRKDLEGRFVFANERFCKYLGVPHDRIIGRGDLDLFPTELAAKYRRDDMLVRDSESNLDLIETNKGADGTVQYVHVVKSPIYGIDGKVVGIQGVFWDVTERRRAEEKLAAEKERLCVTLRSIGDGVVSIDTLGNITLMNQVAEELTGWSHAEAKGRPVTDIFKCVDPKTREAQPCRLAHVLDTGERNEPGHRTLLISRTGKEYLIEDRAAAVRDRQRQIIGAVLVFQDITARQQLETEATKSSRIESIGLLAGGIAHDFNNILTSILGNLSLLKFSKLTPDVSSRVELAEKATLRARDLTQQLLTFAKGGAPVRQTASLREIVKESTDFALRGSKVRAEYDLATDLAPADVDTGQIHQVIHNLVLNAAQAMPEGGLVQIKACNYALMSRAEAPLPPGEYIRISVRDEGPGIPAELLPKIFDPYFTTKRGGNGLGLATAFSIIKRHEGYLTAESTFGEGAVFHLYLPASTNAIVEPVDIAPSNFKGAGKILVMDDEEPVRQLACSMLQHFGYETLAVKDGAEAVIRYNQARRAGAPFAAVIMDLTIPGGMGGRDALQQLLMGDPQVRAIVSSGYSNDPVMAKYREHGFLGVVEKPYTIEELGRVLHEVVPEPAHAHEAYAA
jgi:PAS domain S-box-containing protein